MHRNRIIAFLLAVLAVGCLGRAALAYSFDDPPGPQFTDAQEQAQIDAAKTVVPLVMAAYNSGASTVTIPPGDYRFGKDVHGPNGYIFPVEFDDLRRDAAHPFTIKARGVTFWFDLGDDQCPTCHFCTAFRRCSHVVVDGLTLARGTRGNIEGRITQIDYANNRFEIALCPGVTMPTKFGGAEQRILPFKADGAFCAPLYYLQAGGKHLQYLQPMPGTQPGRWWITPKDTALMTTIRDPNWIKAYGSAGTLNVGDGLSLIYTVCCAVEVSECDDMTFIGINNYIAKGFFGEEGGNGGNLWRNCYSGPRPGTNQWQGGDGLMCNSTKHGSTYDNFTIMRTTDDIINIHGYWGQIESVDGNNVTFMKLAPDAEAGDSLIFYDKQTGAVLGRPIVKSITGNTVTLDNSAEPFADAIAEWPGHECAGWCIKNCDWSDIYQRIYAQSGPGTITNCHFTRAGQGVALVGFLDSGNEGGVPHDITITDNIFSVVAPAPDGKAVRVEAYVSRGQNMAAPIDRITVVGNTFDGSGAAVIGMQNCSSVKIRSNRFSNPLAYAAISRRGESRAMQPVQLTGCSGVTVSGNKLSDPGGFTSASAATGGSLVGADEATVNVSVDGRKVR